MSDIRQIADKLHRYEDISNTDKVTIAEVFDSMLESLKWAIGRIETIESRGALAERHSHCDNDCCYKRAYDVIAKSEGRS